MSSTSIQDRELISGRNKQGCWFRKGFEEAVSGRGKEASTSGVKEEDHAHGHRCGDGINRVFFQTRSTVLLERTKWAAMEEQTHLESRAEGPLRKLLKTEE